MGTKDWGCCSCICEALGKAYQEYDNMTNEYEWHAKMISKNRITIPDMVVREWSLKEGDVIPVLAKRPTRQTRDVII